MFLSICVTTRMVFVNTNVSYTTLCTIVGFVAIQVHHPIDTWHHLNTFDRPKIWIAKNLQISWQWKICTSKIISPNLPISQKSTAQHHSTRQTSNGNNASAQRMALENRKHNIYIYIYIYVENLPKHIIPYLIFKFHFCWVMGLFIEKSNFHACHAEHQKKNCTDFKRNSTMKARRKPISATNCANQPGDNIVYGLVNFFVISRRAWRSLAARLGPPQWHRDFQKKPTLYFCDSSMHNRALDWFSCTWNVMVRFARIPTARLIFTGGQKDVSFLSIGFGVSL